MAEANSFQFIRPNQGRRIDARPRNVEYEEGTGPGTGRTARRVDPGMGGGLDSHFLAQRYKDMPMSQISSFANTMRGRGMMYNPYAGTYQNDSMYNRSGAGYGREPQGPQTEPQMQWAQKAQEKQSGAGALGKIGEKMGLADSAFGPSAASLTTPATGGFAGANPYAGTRSQNIANVKAAGMFDKVRDEFNKQNHRPGGSWMSEEGSIYTTDAKGEIDYDALKKHGFSWEKRDDGLNEASAPRDWRQIQNPASKIVRNPEEFAKTKAEERALQRGSFVTPQTLSKEDEVAGVTSRVAMENPHGRGSFTRYTNTSKKPQSMVKDDFGRWVPMSPYLADKKAVQASKGMI